MSVRLGLTAACAAALACVAVSGCSGVSAEQSAEAVAAPAATAGTPSASAETPNKTPNAAPAPAVPPAPQMTSPKPSSQTAYLSVPGAGISRLKIVTYSGVPDDDRGTEINDSGLAGAPRGSWGGVAPGQVGNLLLTAHRTSAGAPMGTVPELKSGDEIFVDQGATRFVYAVSSKTTINFRSAQSRALQTAAVPGSPGKKPTRPAIVLSTCATPEDNAAGNFWRDEHQNPTHRIAVYGYLKKVLARS